nr:hypothetical protein Iba_chr09cCG11230 [Ipomoea batatas]
MGVRKSTETLVFKVEETRFGSHEIHAIRVHEGATLNPAAPGDETGGPQSSAPPSPATHLRNSTPGGVKGERGIPKRVPKPALGGEIIIGSLDVWGGGCPVAVMREDPAGGGRSAHGGAVRAGTVRRSFRLHRRRAVATGVIVWWQGGVSALVLRGDG